VAVSDGDHELRAEEQGDFTDVHHLLVIYVADRLEYQEHHVVVNVELGSLVCLHCILDRQRRQPELVSDLGDVVCGWLLQPDPHEAEVLRATAAARSSGIRPGTRCPSS